MLAIKEIPLTTEISKIDPVQFAVLRHSDLETSAAPIHNLEVEVRNRQDKELAKILAIPVGVVIEGKATINTNLEVWADQVDEGRRFDHDIYTPWKRPDREVKRFEAVMGQAEASSSRDALMHELISQWTTPTNFLEVAPLLSFTPKETEDLITEFEKGEGIRADAKMEPSLDKSQDWYKSALAAIAVDDIVPLVMLRELIIEHASNPQARYDKPTLRELVRGLHNHFVRELHVIFSEDKTLSVMNERSKALQEQVLRTLYQLRSMKRG